MGNVSGAMDRRASIVWVALILTGSASSQSTESSESTIPPNSQVGRCSRTLQNTFDPLMNNLVENIRTELSTFQHQIKGSLGPQIVIANDNDLATLVAEKLYVKVKDDLISSGTGIISEELSGMKNTFEDRVETLEAGAKQVQESISDLVQVFEDQGTPNQGTPNVFFSAYSQSGGDVTGLLKFPNVEVNFVNGFDPSSSSFNAPVAGYYKFFFSGHQGARDSKNPNHTVLKVKKNSSQVFVIADDLYDKAGHKGNYQNMNSHFVLQLEANDKITLELYQGDYMFANSALRMTFTGELVSKIQE